MNNQWFSKVAVWLVIGLVLFTVFKQFDRGSFSGSQIGYSEFLDEVQANASNRSPFKKILGEALRFWLSPPTTSGFVSRPPISTVGWWVTFAIMG